MLPLKPDPASARDSPSGARSAPRSPPASPTSTAARDGFRQMMIESIGPALDKALLSAAAATPERPAGLLNGIAPLTSTGNPTNDLIMLLSQIAAIFGNSQIALVVAPDKAIANLLPRELRYAILTSASLTTGRRACRDGARNRHRRRRRSQADPLHVSVGHYSSADDVGTIVGLEK